jgi:hypothetical protein
VRFGVLVVVAACSFRPGAIAVDALPGEGDASSPIDARVLDGPPIDARVVDAAPPPDAPLARPAFLVEAHDHADTADALVYALTIPAAARRYLLVTVQVGANCGDLQTPATQSVTFAATPLTIVAQVAGTPACDAAATRSEQWGLVNPPDTGNVVITLAGTVKSVHSGALAFANVNQAAPVSHVVTLAGQSASSSVDVATGPDDLVVNTVGQGNRIDQTGAGQIAQFTQNFTASNTLNNSAASTAPGTGAMVTMTWTFGATDFWQTISTSLQP